MTNKTSDQAEVISKREHRMEGNFPVDLYQVDALDPITGELYFTKRISNADRYLTTDGKEIPDPRPAAPALGKLPTQNIRDYIRTLVRSERLQQELEAAGHETFEEANDFEVGEDYFPDSQYENDLEPSMAELIREGNASLSAKARAEASREAKLKAARRQAAPDEEDPPSQPKKSPRKAPRGLADDPEGASDGDPDAD